MAVLHCKIVGCPQLKEGDVCSDATRTVNEHLMNLNCERNSVVNPVVLLAGGSLPWIEELPKPTKVVLMDQVNTAFFPKGLACRTRGMRLGYEADHTQIIVFGR